LSYKEFLYNILRSKNKDKSMAKPTPINNEKSLLESEFIVSKTDAKGKILYGNKIFIKISGYNESELLGAPHSILRHPDMPKAVFKLLWEMVHNGDEIFAYVLNKTKNGNDYWVYANVTPSYNERNEKVGFYSVRRKPNPQALDIIIPLYKEMIKIDKQSGVEASFKVLTDILNEKGVSYDELIISIQE